MISNETSIAFLPPGFSYLHAHFSIELGNTDTTLLKCSLLWFRLINFKMTLNPENVVIDGNNVISRAVSRNKLTTRTKIVSRVTVEP